METGCSLQVELGEASCYSFTSQLFSRQAMDQKSARYIMAIIWNALCVLRAYFPL